MSIQVQWDEDDPSILYYRFEGRWSWDDLHQTIQVSDQMLDEAGRMTPVIVDARQSTGLPGEGALRNLHHMIGRFHSNLGLTVIVDAEKNRLIPLAQSLVSMVNRIYGTGWRFEYAPTIEEARRLIAEWADKQPS